MFQDIGMGKDFLDNTLKTQGKKGKIDKWGCAKLKSFCTHSKGTINRVK
jgi:hypothetical protein